jgi:hypothetical protein
LKPKKLMIERSKMRLEGKDKDKQELLKHSIKTKTHASVAYSGNIKKASQFNSPVSLLI